MTSLCVDELKSTDHYHYKIDCFRGHLILAYIYRRARPPPLLYLTHWSRDNIADILQTTIQFFNQNCCILNRVSWRFVPKGLIDNEPAFIRIMASCRTGVIWTKPLSEPSRYLNQWWSSSLTNIYVTRPRWINGLSFIRMPMVLYHQLDVTEWYVIDSSFRLFYSYRLKICSLPTRPSWSKDRWVNSLWPSDPIWRQRSGSTLAQIMACCLAAPSHYLNQCRLIISKV